jgi:steroid delta-isomerase-like uncharacterized protein
MNATQAALEQGQGPAALLRRWFDEVWNKGNEAAIDELFPEDSIMWGVSRPDVSSKGPGEFKHFYANMHLTFSDMHIDLEEVIEQGDTAFTRFAVTAHHGGDGLGVAPTNKSISLKGMCCLRAKDGKIIEGWNVWDQVGLLRELGLLNEQASAIFP